MDVEEFIRRLAEGEKQFANLELADASLAGFNLRLLCLRGARTGCPSLTSAEWI